MKLIYLLRCAYAIEIGAYNAYEGHWRSITGNVYEREHIKAIQQDEKWHKEEVGRMLGELNSRPSIILNSLLWVIGKSISLACYIMGHKMAMWGAGVMEKLGIFSYKYIAAEARLKGHRTMASDLEDMQEAEERHQEFFKSRLG